MHSAPLERIDQIKGLGHWEMRLTLAEQALRRTVRVTERKENRCPTGLYEARYRTTYNTWAKVPHYPTSLEDTVHLVDQLAQDSDSAVCGLQFQYWPRQGMYSARLCIPDHWDSPVPSPVSDLWGIVAHRNLSLSICRAVLVEVVRDHVWY